jgi:hypothetical protein
MFHPLAQAIVKTLPGKSVVEFGNQRFGGEGTFDSVKDFYASIGYTDYIALDVNEDKHAKIADLNYLVGITKTYDLVTNNGTGEHIFDQRMIYENAHNLSHKWMLHIMPMIPWINHGFYNYNPILYRDIAAANDYKSLVFIANRWGERIDVPDEDLYKEKRPKLLEEACGELSKRGGVFVCAVFEKRHDKPFELPFQGKYKGDITDERLIDTYV